MVTLVGTQQKFSDALTELVELEYDASEAYQAAIERVKNEMYKQTLGGFLQDHQQHIQALSQLITEHGGVPPQGPDIKQHMLKAKVIAAHMMSDEAILKAMEDNEKDTNTAYERLTTHADQWPDARDILARGFADEKRHKAWLEATLSKHGS